MERKRTEAGLQLLNATDVGVVIKDNNGKAYLVESTTDEAVACHLGPGTCELRERLERSCDYDIVAWRQLLWPGEDEIMNSPDKGVGCNQVSRIAQDALERVYTMLRKFSESEERIERYNLDSYRMAGKIAYSMGFYELGDLLCSSGYDWEFDCCMFVGSVLSELGVLDRTSASELRRLTLPYFTCDRDHIPKGIRFALPMRRGVCYGKQRPIKVKPKLA